MVSPDSHFCCSAKSASNLAATAHCPVCGMTMPPDSENAIEHNEQQYLFCSSACLRRFLVEPEQYTRLGNTWNAELIQANPGLSIGQAQRQSIDPVCGMQVEHDSAAAVFEWQTKLYYFCCQSCQRKFISNPSEFLNARVTQESHHEANGGSGNTSYICPMHPEVTAAEPGDCPACGMPLEPAMPGLSDHEENEVKDLTGRLTWSVLLTLPLVALSMSHMFTGHGVASAILSGWIQFFLCTPVLTWTAAPLLQRGWASVKNRSLNMFTLLTLGMAIPYLYSLIVLVSHTFAGEVREPLMVYFESSSVIATLALVGQLLEAKARVQSSGAVRDLIALMPSDATVVLPDGTDMVIPAADVAYGARVRIRPGERIPVDALVLDGSSSIDESMLTGEPVPVLKTPSSKVTAGTINGTGSLIVQCEHAGTETLLAQIVALVSQAQRSRVPVQRLADRIAAVFVPSVLAISVVTFACWYLKAGNAVAALSAAAAVLVVACPCALGLATPMSIVVAAGRGARSGVLFKEARSLQLLANLDTLVLDKTGTLTEGKPKLVDIACFAATPEDLLSFAAAVELHSEHPLAAAIVNAAAQKAAQPLHCREFESSPGLGVRGNVEGKTVVVGTLVHLRNCGVESAGHDTEDIGRTSVFVALDGKCAGRLDFTDALRPTSAAAVKELQQRGIHIVIATGDNEHSAAKVATELGITEFHAGLLPAAKAGLIETLRKQGVRVAMAGDGINDAPALAQADVGIALASGTDVAINSADIVLMQNDIRGIVRAIKISRAMLKNIAQNLALAFGYNIVAIPAAAGIFIPIIGLALDPMAAAAAMSVSSVAVIANALRLNKLEL